MFARFEALSANVSTTASIIDRFEPISLAEMDGVKLQDRVDTKYVFGEDRLPEVFTAMLPDYRLLEVDGTRGTQYRSLYFDTADLKQYKDHHNKRTFRSKVRFREYIGSDLVFLEVKRKTGRGRTDKKRIRVDGIRDELTSEQQAFVMKSSGLSQPVQATLWNYFTRYTFVNKNAPERLTMDVGLRYSDVSGERELGGIVIAELKQERADRTSPFVRIMRSRVMQASGMSKYCVGMLLMQRNVKHNAFKAVLLKLQQLRKAA
ncbi:MAG: polyphosphate polymerase domain-containing protein [Flavobacteriales bacterium]|nr:polyphosphate polymerase domain-containing protein [Flavobacteriales bacterium]